MEGSSALEFRVVQWQPSWSETPVDGLVPFVDGRSLVELAAVAGEKSHAGIADPRVAWPERHYLDTRHPIELLGCSCSDLLCNPVWATVTVTDQLVTWSQWRAGTNKNESVKLPRMQFDREAYEQAVTSTRALREHDRDWVSIAKMFQRSRPATLVVAAPPGVDLDGSFMKLSAALRTVGSRTALRLDDGTPLAAGEHLVLLSESTEVRVERLVADFVAAGHGPLVADRLAREQDESWRPQAYLSGAATTMNLD